jgi:hypothetical protein
MQQEWMEILFFYQRHSRSFIRKHNSAFTHSRSIPGITVLQEKVPERTTLQTGNDYEPKLNQQHQPAKTPKRTTAKMIFRDIFFYF